MNWWPLFIVEVALVQRGLKRAERFFVKAPSAIRAEELTNYRYESDVNVTDWETNARYANP